MKKNDTWLGEVKNNMTCRKINNDNFLSSKLFLKMKNNEMIYSQNPKYTRLNISMLKI